MDKRKRYSLNDVPSCFSSFDKSQEGCIHCEFSLDCDKFRRISIENDCVPKQKIKELINRLENRRKFFLEREDHYDGNENLICISECHARELGMQIFDLEKLLEAEQSEVLRSRGDAKQERPEGSRSLGEGGLGTTEITTPVAKSLDKDSGKQVQEGDRKK